jgi:hypothetical protein
VQILELINLPEQPNENGECHTVMRYGKEQEGTIKFLFSLMLRSCAGVCALVLAIPMLGTVTYL